MTSEQKRAPGRLGRLSMGELSLEDALRGALKVKPPEQPKRKPRKSGKRKKAK